MGYVFISYSTQNQSMADSMKQLLSKNGIDSWMAPADIPAGSKYAQVITQAIKECSCVLLLLSQASQNSPWVAKEIERAVNYKKMILPVQLEDMVLNDEFELYISNNQIVAVNQIDDSSAEVQKILMSLQAICVAVTKEMNIQYRISVLSDSGSLFIYSNESLSKEEAKLYTMSEYEWQELAKVIAEYVAYLYHTEPELVVVTLRDTLNDKRCAPLDGRSYYDKEFRINFGISYISTCASKIYDSVHIDVSDVLKLTFFKKGDYIFKTISHEAALSDIGLEEETCVNLSRRILGLLYPSKKVITSQNFENDVYKDNSGGFRLRFLVR